MWKLGRSDACSNASSGPESKRGMCVLGDVKLPDTTSSAVCGTHVAARRRRRSEE